MIDNTRNKNNAQNNYHNYHNLFIFHANNNNVGQYSITILSTIYILSFIHMLKSHDQVFSKATSCYFVSLIVRLFTFYRLDK